MALYDPGAHAALATVYGNHDVGVCAHVVAAWTLEMLGESAEAMALSRAGLDLAARLRHPFTEALALVFAAHLHRFRGDAEAASAGRGDVDAAGVEGTGAGRRRTVVGQDVRGGQGNVASSCRPSHSHVAETPPPVKVSGTERGHRLPAACPALPRTFRPERANFIAWCGALLADKHLCQNVTTGLASQGKSLPVSAICLPERAGMFVADVSPLGL
jgi:hypothetical protein